jgi:UTP--glucose-1-phosphate uridylyltransferase
LGAAQNSFTQLPSFILAPIDNSLSLNQKGFISSMSQRIKKAVITAGGFGSRFLPASKSIPKELVPIINKPTIHYLVDQCVENGIEEIFIVSKPENKSIEEYFAQNVALEQYLVEKGKTKELEVVKKIYNQAKITFVMQDESLPYGNARPLYTVKDLVAGEPFIYMYGDEFIWGKEAGIKELMDVFESQPSDIVIMCEKARVEEIPRLGMVKFKEGTNIIEQIVEKPKMEETPSDIGSHSPYIFSPEIFDYLDPTKMDKSGEFILQTAVDAIAQKGTVRGVVTKGIWLTNGDPLAFLMSTVEVALTRDDTKEAFTKYLKERVSKL